MSTYLLSALCLALAILYWRARTNYRNLIRVGHYRRRHHQSLVGGTPTTNGWVDYNLRSWDGGRTWFSVAFDEDFRMTITGPADSAILAKALGCERLLDHVAASGPLRLSDAEDQTLLSAGGFHASYAEPNSQG